MADNVSTNPPNEGVVTHRHGRGKPKVMQAALLMWAHHIYHRADDAVKKAGGYAGYNEDRARFSVYAKIVKKLQALAEELEKLPEAQDDLEKTVSTEIGLDAYLQGGCEDDQDCPDDQICVHGSCHPLYPQS